jgi:hypothetical protein
MEMVLGGLIAFLVEAVVIALLLGWRPLRRNTTPRSGTLRERIAHTADRWHLRPPHLAR